MRFLQTFLTICLTGICLVLPATASQRHHRVVRAHTRHASRNHSRRSHTVRHSRASHRGRHSRPARSAHVAPTKYRRRSVGKRRQSASFAQPGIMPARATEIQNALIRAGYLQRGSGVWDAETQAALRRYQKDHHWQDRIVPDARALIALGLGPQEDQSALDPAARTAPSALAQSEVNVPAGNP